MGLSLDWHLSMLRALANRLGQIQQTAKAGRKRLDADGEAGVWCKLIEFLNPKVHLIEPMPTRFKRMRFAFGDFQYARESRHVFRKIVEAHSGIPVREAS